MRCLVLFVILFPLIAFSQRENNIWYFGADAGLDFNPGSPIPLTDGQINAGEGCASIADANGNLLFYTNGMTVWNKLHQVMGTGLLGNGSSTQSAIIVPKPNSNTIYYVFTVAAFDDTAGLNYSEIDMTLSGGLGAIASQNIQLVTPTSEKLTAVLHSNGTDIWVITHKSYTDAFYSYLITASGVDINPFISHAGYVTGGWDCFGYMKSSPDGERLALAQQNTNSVGLFDFNKSTGEVSNPISFYNVNGPYGVEFSPSNQLLYVLEAHEFLSKLYQYDLNAPNIALSQTLIGEVHRYGGALQMAPDGKMYVTSCGAYFLGIINNPNILGIGCGFIEDGIYLDGSWVCYGLPAFVNQYSSSSFSYDVICLNDTTQFTTWTSNYDSLYWNFGNPSSGVLNFSEESNPTHFYSDTGAYIVTLVVYSNGNADTSFQYVNITTPVFTLGNDTVLCEGETLPLSVNLTNVSYVWQDDYVSPVYNVDEEGSYWVEVRGNGCSTSIRDTIDISYKPMPTVSLGENTDLCEGDTLLLNAFFSNATYLWQDSSINPTFIVEQQGYYDVEVTLNGCTETDFINVSYSPKPIVNLGSDILVCGDSLLSLNVLQQGGSYLWQDGSSSPGYTVYEEGIYTIEVTVENCSNSDTITIVYNPLPIVNLINDTVICQNDTLILDATQANSLYVWQDGSTDSVFSVKEEGVYWVEVITDGCAASDTVNIQMNYCDITLIIPNVFTPDNDEINDEFYMENLPENSSLVIYNRWGQAILEEKNYQNNWDAHEVSAGVYYYIITLPDNEKKKGFVQVIK